MKLLSTPYKIGLICVAVLLLLVLFPTVFDARSSIYDYSKWSADSFGLIFGYVALIIGLGLLPISGGDLRRGLSWFAVGMFVMGSAMFFGPVINHYKLVDPDLVEGIHGIFMFGGMIGYLLANYWFIKIVEPTASARRSMTYAIIAFALFVMFFYPTMAVHRTTGNTIKYWFELMSFGISGTMLAMTVHAYGSIGRGYKKAMNMLLLSTVIFAASYPFGPVGQPNRFWTGAQGGTVHHGLMAVGIISFLITALYLRGLDIYSEKSAQVYTPRTSSL